MEVEGEGFWVASRRGLRHAMEDGYGVITHKIEGHSQMVIN
jgi:protein phosphatase 1L